MFSVLPQNTFLKFRLLKLGWVVKREIFPKLKASSKKQLLQELGNIAREKIGKPVYEIANVLMFTTIANSFGEFDENCIDLRKGNSLISINGMNGKRNHSGFFKHRTTHDAFEWYQEFNEPINETLFANL